MTLLWVRHSFENGLSAVSTNSTELTGFWCKWDEQVSDW